MEVVPTTPPPPCPQGEESSSSSSRNSSCSCDKCRSSSSDSSTTSSSSCSSNCTGCKAKSAGADHDTSWLSYTPATPPCSPAETSVGGQPCTPPSSCGSALGEALEMCGPSNDIGDPKDMCCGASHDMSGCNCSVMLQAPSGCGSDNAVDIAMMDLELSTTVEEEDDCPLAAALRDDDVLSGATTGEHDIMYGAGNLELPFLSFEAGAPMDFSTPVKQPPVQGCAPPPPRMAPLNPAAGRAPTAPQRPGRANPDVFMSL
ncbi:uncharacterized protein DDB_G0271670-like [Frankliniella occidentalis]|uniref:Uncharacterized protein DDB_G0271670-like n=1 Tax=Frankliniella occidentalis TaxID=133901 RepID=A0A9C6X738_FRAOC|nr:uncharacterized protein DDB_G0271670-like [Frankliniella occidentalis]